MAFLDGPFGMQPRQRYSGLFGSAIAPVGASPGVNVGGSETNSFAMPVANSPRLPVSGAPAILKKSPTVTARPTSPVPPVPAAKPAPYAYAGPSMSILNAGQLAADQVPVKPATSVNSIFGAGKGGGGLFGGGPRGRMFQRW